MYMYMYSAHNQRIRHQAEFYKLIMCTLLTIEATLLEGPLSTFRPWAFMKADSLNVDSECHLLKDQQSYRVAGLYELSLGS